MALRHTFRVKLERFGTLYARALVDAQALEAFDAFPVGKRSHIIRWIEDAAREATRDKRIAKTVDVVLEKMEREEDRAARRRR